MQPLTDTELQAMRERCAKATAGPWIIKWYWGDETKAKAENSTYPVLSIGVEGSWEAVAHGWMMKVDNATLIAHARDDLPRLITEVERLRAELARKNWLGYNSALGDRVPKSALQQIIDAATPCGSGWVSPEKHAHAVETYSQAYQRLLADLAAKDAEIAKLKDDIAHVRAGWLTEEHQQWIAAKDAEIERLKTTLAEFRFPSVAAARNAEELAAKDARIKQLETELDEAAQVLQATLPIGQVKGIGLLEVAAGVRLLVEWIAELEAWKAHALNVDLNRECQLLRERVAELEAALDPFGNFADVVDGLPGAPRTVPDSASLGLPPHDIPQWRPTLGHCRAAAAALAKGAKP